MGDFYVNIVPEKIDKKSAKSIANLVVRHLVERKIIADTLTDCVGQDKGFPPGKLKNEFVQELEQLTGHTIKLVYGKL